MFLPVLLRLTRREGDLHVLCGEPGTRPVEAVVDGAPIDAAAAVERRELAALGLLRADDDPLVTEIERTLGRSLGSSLLTDPGVAGRLGRAVGQARASGATLCVGLDIEDDAWARLPWELLALEDSPLEPSGAGLVARVVGSAVSSPAPHGPEVRARVWTTDEHDPQVRAVAEQVRASCRQHLGREPDSIGALPGETGPPELLFLVCHAASLGPLLAVRAGGASLSAQSVVHELVPAIRRAGLVIIAACDAGRGTHPASLCAGVLAAGARACLAPTGPAHARAARAFVDAGVRAAVRGADVGTITQEARRAVAALNLPVPDGRWHRWALSAGSLDAVSARLAPPHRALPHALGQPGPAARALLGQAWHIAQGLGAGFVGVEHLVLALLELPPIPGLEAMRYRALTLQSEVHARLGALTLRSADASLTPTPRLQATLAALPVRYEPHQLLRAMQPAVDLVLGPAGSACSIGDGDEDTVRTAEPCRRAASAVEVLGGPEDGRMIRLHPGRTLGRTHRGGTGGLYDGTATTDLRVSREHLTVHASGELHLTRAARLDRGGQLLPVEPGSLRLGVGERLWLSPATCLAGADVAAGDSP